MLSKKYVKSLEEINENDNTVDFAGILVRIDGKICWNIGKHKGTPVFEELDYLKWAIKNDVLPKYLVDWLRKNWSNK